MKTTMSQGEVAKCDAQRLGPLRVVTNENYYDPNFTGAQFHIFTKPDERPGNLNNFAVAEVYNEADANFIVKAANCHDDLLEACKVALQASKDWEQEELRGQLYKAIRKAGAL